MDSSIKNCLCVEWVEMGWGMSHLAQKGPKHPQKLGPSEPNEHPKYEVLIKVVYLMEDHFNSSIHLFKNFVPQQQQWSGDWNIPTSTGSDLFVCLFVCLFDEVLKSQKESVWWRHYLD